MTIKCAILSISFGCFLISPVASWAEEIKDCYHVSTKGRRTGAISGAVVGTGVGGGLCAAGILLAGISFGVTAVVGCATGAVIGTSTGAYIGAEIGDTTDYKCPENSK